MKYILLAIFLVHVATATELANNEVDVEAAQFSSCSSSCSCRQRCQVVWWVPCHCAPCLPQCPCCQPATTTTTTTTTTTPEPPTDDDNGNGDKCNGGCSCQPCMIWWMCPRPCAPSCCRSSCCNGSNNSCCGGGGGSSSCCNSSNRSCCGK